MAEATEIVFIPLKKTVDTQDPKFNDVLGTILKQGKPHRMYTGRQIENPDNFNMFIDWSSIDHHMEFTKWEGYNPFLEQASELSSGPLHLYHVHFDPAPPTAALGAASEFLQAYFPADYSAEDQKAFHDGMKTFAKAIIDTWEGCGGYAGGWVHEEQDEPKSGEKSKVYVGLISWSSVESHEKYRETDTFKNNIGVLRAAKGLKNVAVCHVEAKEFKV